jgi:hypothetical protein
MDAQADRWRTRMHEIRRAVNAQHGLRCRGHADHPHLWGLWPEDGDIPLVPWTDLGPHGYVHVVWADARTPADMVLALETRDDDARPPVAHVRLMRLPGGAVFGQVCSAAPDHQVEALGIDTGTPLLRWFPHGREADPGAGYGLLDPDFRERMPPVIRWNQAWPVTRAVLPHLVRYPHVAAGDAGGWGVFDIDAGRDVILPVHSDLDWDRHGNRWVANRADGTSALLSVDGSVLHHHAHRLFLCSDGRLCACRDGLWGIADETGALVGPPGHASLHALLNPPPVLGPLVPPAPKDAPGDEDAVLPDTVLRTLQAHADRGGADYPFEGLAAISFDGHDSGVVECERVTMPDSHHALRLTLRHARMRWLVLEHAWHGRPPGSLLRLGARPGKRGTTVRPCPPGGPDEVFLTAALTPF